MNSFSTVVYVVATFRLTLKRTNLTVSFYNISLHRSLIKPLVVVVVEGGEVGAEFQKGGNGGIVMLANLDIWQPLNYIFFKYIIYYYLI